MEKHRSSPLLSASDLQRAWLDNVQRVEKITRQDMVNALLGALSLVTPQAFYEVLAVPSHRIFKRKMLDHYYPAVLVFVWQKALEIVHPLHVAGCMRLFEYSFLRRMPDAERRLKRMGQHLTLFSLLTDRFAEDGFMSVAHHMVVRVWGDIEKKPDNLMCSVHLADYMDGQFDRYTHALRNREIHNDPRDGTTS